LKIDPHLPKLLSNIEWLTFFETVYIWCWLHKSDSICGDRYRLPLPPANFSTLYKDDKRFFESYFQKYPVMFKLWNMC